MLSIKIEYRKADIVDAELLIDIYNSSSYNDYVKYGECPAYGKTKEMMEKSIINYPKFIILYNNKPVGCISCKKMEVGKYKVLYRKITTHLLSIARLAYLFSGSEQIRKFYPKHDIQLACFA